ncbi:hypothetical protein DFH07DRAFT_948266 [Mycena maculata]|uniref:Uncharacterized protein n=1 Tax=Mycena maculata TaxID=230809 RepID=A0AAD7KGM4_9AGAR|nr:hypothetical protein DFH07DRAFT_948266 [Mycena maculata]
MVVENQIGQFILWDKARGSVNTVFLDPKSHATPAGGSSAPPVRQVFSSNPVRVSKDGNRPFCQSTPEIPVNEQAQETTQEALGNSTGELPTPSREVPDVELGESDDDTDEIYFLAREDPEPDEQERCGGEYEEAAHTVEVEDDGEDARVYLPGDDSRSPRRDDSTDAEARAGLEGCGEDDLAGIARVSSAVWGRHDNYERTGDTQRGYNIPA